MPDVLTRVSEFIQPIIVYIQKIIARGLAYESNGSVCVRQHLRVRPVHLLK
jgi:cysteinyl-tRNA synthetase